MTMATGMDTTITATGTTITDASLLQLIWLASPALPVGGFVSRLSGRADR